MASLQPALFLGVSFSTIVSSTLEKANPSFDFRLLGVSQETAANITALGASIEGYAGTTFLLESSKYFAIRLIFVFVSLGLTIPVCLLSVFS